VLLFAFFRECVSVANPFIDHLAFVTAVKHAAASHEMLGFFSCRGPAIQLAVSDAYPYESDNLSLATN
jgi:hypothetical protein